MTIRMLLLAGTALAAGPLHAQAQPPAAPPPPVEDRNPGDHLHEEQPDDIIITAPLRDLDLLAGTSVLSGEELLRDVKPQLGDTLTRLPGVSATSFSPGASRPVLRGFQGERVRVLTDGLGSLDVSNTSADHAVTIDPLTAYRIEVLKGPAVLLFGSQAIGGAVNVLDRRIPRTVPAETVHTDIVGTLGSAADERSLGLAVDVPLGGGLVFHLDGSLRESEDMRTGGFVLAPPLRAERLAIAAEELEEGHAEEAAEALELANLRGRIPNSATEQKTIGAGLALIRDRFNVGASVSWFDSDYGVPMRPGFGHHEEEEEEEQEEGEHDGHGEAPVTIALEQIRADLRAEVRLGSGLFEIARLRLGWSEYEHTEFEGDAVGTVFANEGVEGRLEIAQRRRGSWSGASGAQVFHRDFVAVGAEAFLPPNKTTQYGLFTLQEVKLGRVGVEGAARFERSDVESPPLGVERSFNAFSLAAGASFEPARNVKLGFNVARSERAPSAEELFSDGPHIATQAFEVGDPTLGTERSWGGEIYVRAKGGPFEISASLFGNRFDDYIYQALTGEEEDGLPVVRYFQADAGHWGFEAGASLRLFEAAGFRFVADAVADYVRATVRGAGPAPRIPPLRLLGGFEARSPKLDARVEVERIDDQARTAAVETPTKGFNMVNASVSWRPWGRRSQAAVVLAANNIFDVEARRHASFTKDFVPLAGRDLRLSVRLSF